MANVIVDKKALIEGERPIFQASYGKLMMWFFLVSDAFTFSGLLIAYGALRIQTTSEGLLWAGPETVFTHAPILHEIFHIDAPLVFVGLMTFILILSSVTMVLAVEAGHRKSKAEVSKWVKWTIVGGVAFLSCQAYEWYHFISGTPNGGVMLLASKLDSEQTEAERQQGIPVLGLDKKTKDWDELKLVELYPTVDANHEVTALALRNGDKVPSAQIEEILDAASHTHAETYVLDYADAKKLNLASPENVSVKAYIVYGQDPNNPQDSVVSSIRLTNGYQIENDGKNVDYLLSSDPSGKSVPRTQGGSGLKANQYGPPDFAGLFFFVTGFHGTHVFSGVVLLFILLINVNKGTYERRGHYEMTEKIGLYWHFVDLVWVFVFTFFYLV